MPDEMRLIVNPERGDAADGIEDLAVDVARPTDPDGLVDAARRAETADVVAAVGGDGTQRSVADVLAGHDASLLVVPAGTVNLLGRLHGIETVADARRALVEGRDHRIDLGRCNGAPFVLNASSGYDAEVMAALDDDVKRFGRLGIGVVGAVRLVRSHRRACRVRVDGRMLHEGDASAVLVMNVAHRGSTTRALVPDASPDDGLLHVLVFRTRRSVVRTIWSVVRGRHARAVTGTGVRIEVDWDEDVAAQRDGDADARGRRFDYEVEPGALVLRVPR